jgi:glycerate dehydrogenase
LLLELTNRTGHHARTVREGRWSASPDWCYWDYPLVELDGLTFGVVGYGRIGRQAGSYLRGLGFTVCAHDEYVDVPPEDGVAAVPLEKLLETSDVVTLHAPGDPSGRPLLGAAELGRMKPGSVLVNTARGSLIDLPALREALAAGRPAYAALDVYPSEPVEAAVFAPVADRVLLTPHMAWYTEESEADMRRKAAEEAARLLRGEPLREPVV